MGIARVSRKKTNFAFSIMIKVPKKYSRFISN